MPWGRCGLWPVVTWASRGPDNRCPKHPEALEFQRDDSGLLSCWQLFWDLFHGAVSASWPGCLSLFLLPRLVLLPPTGCIFCLTLIMYIGCKVDLFSFHRVPRVQGSGCHRDMWVVRCPPPLGWGDSSNWVLWQICSD